MQNKLLGFQNDNKVVEAGSTIRGMRKDTKAAKLQRLARRLANQHGLQNWKVFVVHPSFFSRGGAGIAGMCLPYPPEIRSQTDGAEGALCFGPTLARKTLFEQRHTILHEIAHARSDNNHGVAWVKAALILGLRPADLLLDVAVGVRTARSLEERVEAEQAHAFLLRQIS